MRAVRIAELSRRVPPAKCLDCPDAAEGGAGMDRAANPDFFISRAGADRPDTGSAGMPEASPGGYIMRPH